MNNINIGKLFRLTIIVLWVILFGRLLSRDYFIEKLEIRETQAIQRGIEESYMGIYFQKERIGYVKNQSFVFLRKMVVSTNSFVLLQQLHL